MTKAQKPDPASTQKKFEIVLRGREQPAPKGRKISGKTVVDTFKKALNRDVSSMMEPVLEWKDKTKAVALDYDRPEGESPLEDIDLDDLFPDTLPKPCNAWITHGGGLRVVFVEVDGRTALELAGVWAVTAPLKRLKSWELEIKFESRHPDGARTVTGDGQPEEQKCGPVHYFIPSSNLIVPGARGSKVASDADRQGYMDEHGLAYGRRSTEGCPICGRATRQSGNDPILIDEHGVHCFRCDRHATWDQLVGHAPPSDRPSMYEAARHRVHFPHQRFVLKYDNPQVPKELLKPAWRLILFVANEDWINGDDAEREKRLAAVERAASEHNPLVRSSSNTWLDASCLRVRTKITATTAWEMPWVQSGTQAEMALDRVPLDGFTLVHPLEPSEVVAPHVEPPAGAVTARRPRLHGAPPPADVHVRYSRNEVDAAWAGLEEKLPGITGIRGYLSGLVTAAFVAQRHIGTPPVVAATGPTGAAKSAGQVAAAAMIGRPAKRITLGESKAVFRQVGLALEEGCGLLYVDEAGRIPKMYQKLGDILSLNHECPFEAKYQNERAIPLTASISIIGSTIPLAVTRSPELSRRAIGYRLIRPVGDWRSVVDLTRARYNEDLRPLLDVVTADLWQRLNDLGKSGDWRRLCMDEYGAVELSGLDIDDVDGAGRDEAIRQLYMHYISAPASEFTTGTSWSGWLDATPQNPASSLLSELVDFDEDKKTRRAQMEELQRVNLGHVLGFSDPLLVLRVHQRSARYLCKFRELGVAKGKEAPRHLLPPIVQAAPSTSPTAEAPTSPDGDDDDPDGPGNGGGGGGSTGPITHTGRRTEAGAGSVTHADGGRDGTSGEARDQQDGFCTSCTDAHGDLHPATPEEYGFCTLRTDPEPEKPADQGALPHDQVSESETPCTTSTTSESKGLGACATPQDGCATPIFVDIESRSKVSLHKVGGRRYVQDPTTEVLCLVGLLPNDGSWVEWAPGDPPPPELIRAVEDGAPVAAHNCLFFDKLIWEKLGWPSPSAWVDTAHLARMAGLPGRLEDLGTVLFEKGKDQEGRKLTLALSRIDPRTGLLPHIDLESKRKVVEYCRRDVELVRDAWRHRLHRFDTVEEEVRQADQAINERGFLLDVDLARAIIEVDEQDVQKSKKSAPVSGTTLASQKKLKAWLAEAGFPVADVQRGTLEDLQEDPDLPDTVRRVLAARLASSRVSTKKLKTALRQVGADGRIRDSLSYYVAHTGRWSGRGIQPQNLPMGLKLKPDELDTVINATLKRDLKALRAAAKAKESTLQEVLATLVRPCIRAPDGKLLAAVDFRSIEARVLLWVAGDEAGLDEYRADVDAYRRMASIIYSAPVEDVDDEQRRLGKALVLGCGYQMGKHRFELHAQTFGIDWKQVPFTPQQAVDGWRDAHTSIAGTNTGREYKGIPVRTGGLWKDVEAAAWAAIKYGGSHVAGRCRWSCSNGDMHCRLPSGRIMVYRDVGIEKHPAFGDKLKETITYARRVGQRVTTYGGKLTENVVQAISRDILAGALVRLQKAGVKVILHIHDEVVCEVESEEELEEIEEIMRVVPKWAEGLPLDVEGYVAARYRK